MAYLLTILMLVILFACVATLYGEGMWSNAILLVNIVTAALLATNFFEPLAQWLDDWQPSYTYAWDFLALWGLFALFMLILRIVTDKVSLVRVRFLKVADKIGGPVFAFIVGLVMVNFTMMTLHTAPLAKNFLFDAFQPRQSMFLGLAPDKMWLGFARNLSQGAFCREEWDKHVFDAESKFMDTYELRRTALEANVKKFDSICPQSR